MLLGSEDQRALYREMPVGKIAQTFWVGAIACPIAVYAVRAVIAFAVYIDLRRFVLPALRFRPEPVDIALRIERMRPELSGRLASAVDFELSAAFLPRF